MASDLAVQILDTLRKKSALPSQKNLASGTQNCDYKGFSTNVQPQREPIRPPWEDNHEHRRHYYKRGSQKPLYKEHNSKGRVTVNFMMS